MTKYSVILSGNAIESYLFSLDEQKYELAQSKDLSNLNFDQLILDLQIQDRGEANIILTGLIDDNQLTISVYNENDELVYQQLAAGIEKEFFKTIPDDELFIINENKIKGDILRFEFETEDFDPSYLGLATTVIGYHYVVTSVKWREEYLEINTDYLDYESIGSETYLI